MRIQLNHPYGETCFNPIRSYNNDFTVIDLNSIHQVSVDYCNCHMVQPCTIQLLHFQLYPATIIDPKTAATFQVLEFFHLNTLISKISVFDFYVTLHHIMDNTGTWKIPVRPSNNTLRINVDCWTVPLSVLSYNDTAMATSQAIEGYGPRTSPRREEGHNGRRLRCPLPGLSPAR